MFSVLRSEVRQAREGMGAGSSAVVRPWARTGSVDVELLAQWAYGAQAVDRFERRGLHAIEAAAAGYDVSRMSADGVGQLMQIEHLGCRIDRGSPIVSDAVHPAALAVAGALREIAGGDRVRTYAQAGSRPVLWQEPRHKARASTWVKEGERAQVEYQGPGRAGAYCPVIIVWSAQRRDWGRADYSAWWEALAELAWQLSMRSLGFVVSGPAAPARPWELADGGKRASPSSISIDEVAAGTPLTGPPSAPSNQ